MARSPGACLTDHSDPYGTPPLPARAADGFDTPGFESGPEADLIGRVLVDTFGSENPPPSSWIGVQALAQPEYLVEVEAMAIVPDIAAVAPGK
ncbi:hypothetical protein ACWCO0_08740 [Streptomyces tubercidicus]